MILLKGTGGGGGGLKRQKFDDVIVQSPLISVEIK